MKKIKFKKLGIVLAGILLVCGLGVGAYYIFRDPNANQQRLQSHYNILTRSNETDKTKGLLEILQTKYTTSGGNSGEDRITQAVATLEEMDNIAVSLSQYLTFGTGNENVADDLDDALEDILEDRQDLIKEINKAINNLNDSTQGELIEGYVRIFEPTADYITDYARFMSGVCDYIKTYNYRNNPPAHIAVYNLYFDSVVHCYNNLEPTQVQFKPIYFNAMYTIQSNISITNGEFDYNTSLENGQFSQEVVKFVEQYYKISNKYAYAGRFYEFYSSRMAADNVNASAEERTTYYLGLVW